MIDRERVLRTLQKSWSQKTSTKWSAANPASGQCSVTALAVQDRVGGRLLKTRVGVRLGISTMRLMARCVTSRPNSLRRGCGTSTHQPRVKRSLQTLHPANSFTSPKPSTRNGRRTESRCGFTSDRAGTMDGVSNTHLPALTNVWSRHRYVLPRSPKLQPDLAAVEKANLGLRLNRAAPFGCSPPHHSASHHHRSNTRRHRRAL